MSQHALARTFADDALEADLERDGFVVVDLLHPEQVGALRDVFEDLDHPIRHGFFASNETEAVDYKRETVGRVQEIVGPAVLALLAGHRLIGGFFMIKWPDEDSAMAPHLDWSLVDEERFRSVSAWIPLTDTDGRNGALVCVRGSHHRVRNTHRGSPDFPTTTEVGHLADELPAEDHRRFDLRPGQAVLYTHQTIHYSAPNTTDRPRPAVNIAALPNDAVLVHHRLLEDGRVERQWVDDTFVESWRRGDEPPAPLRVDTVERVDHLDAAPKPTAAAGEGSGDGLRRRWWRR
ncbi:MAG: phytanoyl-CoA dioxygenase family protein [Acidimicrobiales bacterium]|nr:phytanoyl-CoA dioxygenase family protein [Acidimicrobiales bacterium]